MPQKILFGIVAAVVCGLLLEWLLNPFNLMTVVLSLLVGAAVVIVLIARSRGESPQEVATEAVQAARPDPGAEERRVHEQLVRTNKEFRLRGHGSAESLTLFESLVDKLRVLVPQAMERMHDSETTFDLKQLSITHLPHIVENFLRLSEGDRREKEPQFCETLGSIRAKVDRLQDIVNQELRTEFDAEAGFANMKFQ